MAGGKKHTRSVRVNNPFGFWLLRKEPSFSSGCSKGPHLYCARRAYLSVTLVIRPYVLHALDHRSPHSGFHVPLYSAESRETRDIDSSEHRVGEARLLAFGFCCIAHRASESSSLLSASVSSLAAWHAFVSSHPDVSGPNAKRQFRFPRVRCLDVQGAEALIFRCQNHLNRASYLRR